jgi:hypothetical protein
MLVTIKKSNIEFSCFSPSGSSLVRFGLRVESSPNRTKLEPFRKCAADFIANLNSQYGSSFVHIPLNNFLEGICMILILLLDHLLNDNFWVIIFLIKQNI